MSSKLGNLNKAIIDVAQELAFALIAIRDTPMPTSMLANDAAYGYAMQIRERADDGLANLNKLQEAIRND